MDVIREEQGNQNQAQRKTEKPKKENQNAKSDERWFMAHTDHKRALQLNQLGILVTQNKYWYKMYPTSDTNCHKQRLL